MSTRNKIETTNLQARVTLIAKKRLEQQAGRLGLPLASLIRRILEDFALGRDVNGLNSKYSAK